MDYSKVIEVLSITMPVFLLAGIGKILQLSGVLTAQNKSSLSWLTYYLALPALILNSFLTQDTRHLMQLDLLWLSMIGIAVPAFVSTLLLWQSSAKKERKMATIYCSYWGNNGYMGIPLAASALGASGVALAAVINGMATPLFIVSAVTLMFAAKKHSHDAQKFKKEAFKTLFQNPVLIALFLGMVFSFLRPYLPAVQPQSLVGVGGSVFMATLAQIGHMGLPLALILVGSSLQLEEIKEDVFPLFVSVTGKLIIAPLAVFISAQLFFPNLQRELLIAIVLLNAVPAAVASYIIGERFEVAPQFTSSNLVISTGLSIITLPLWLYFLL